VLRVNGKPIPWHEGITFPEIYAALGYTLRDPLVVVRVDGRLVEKAERDDFSIPDGASIEIINKLRGG
jgi:thiamine biosynthesis protein ThiS